MTPPAPQRQIPGASSPLTRAVLTGSTRGALVLASFPRALYLSVGEHQHVLPVVATDALILPTATRLPAAGPDLDWGVEPGDLVSVGRSLICLPDWRIRLVREWRPSRVRPVPWTPEAAGSTLAKVADTLSRYLRTPGLVDQASAVCRAARSGDEANVRHLTRHLLGWGPGLTPSGDDAMCAVLLVLRAAGDPAPLSLLGAAVEEHWARTTSLSASLLDAARRGYAVADVVTLVECALRGDLRGAGAALTSTLTIGHSSGADLVAGLAGSLGALAEETAQCQTAECQTAERQSL